MSATWPPSLRREAKNRVVKVVAKVTPNMKNRRPSQFQAKSGCCFGLNTMSARARLRVSFFSMTRSRLLGSLTSVTQSVRRDRADQAGDEEHQEVVADERARDADTEDGRDHLHEAAEAGDLAALLFGQAVGLREQQ